MKKIALCLSTVFLLGSCVSNKKYVELQEKHQATADELAMVKTNLQKCLIEKEGRETKNYQLSEQVKYLKEDKKNALKQVENLTVLTQSSSDAVKNVISQLSEKDKYINGVRRAMSQKDSLNLAIKYHLTKNLTEGIQDKDIEVNVEKTVVFISISDKLLFESGKYTIQDKASEIIGKIAKVIKDQPSMEVMVEGHTDSNPISTQCITDNWDLSSKRAAAVVRMLQNDYGVKPGRLIAAGRSSYVPLAQNDSPANMAKNRRTKIIIMPKLNQFFDLLEQDAD